MTDILTIKIPFELARYATAQRKTVTTYDTNAIIKALDTWLILKSLSRPSFLQSWNKQKSYLFKVCKCSESIFRSRLKQLQALELVEFDKNNIRLCSWSDMGSLLEIDTTQKITIKYDTTKPQRIQEWLIAAEIQHNKNSQDYKIIRKLQENPEVLEEIKNTMIGDGADKEKLKEQSYFLNRLRSLYWQDFQEASYLHDVYVQIRPDNNRGVRGMARAWTPKQGTKEEIKAREIKNISRIMYWKKKLIKAGIIYVYGLEIESTTRTRNKHCHVLWLPECKKSPRKDSFQTLLCLCDQIDLLTPWLDITDMAIQDEVRLKLSA